VFGTITLFEYVIFVNTNYMQLHYWY